jgi:hypothetical protein
MVAIGTLVYGMSIQDKITHGLVANDGLYNPDGKIKVLPKINPLKPYEIGKLASTYGDKGKELSMVVEVAGHNYLGTVNQFTSQGGYKLMSTQIVDGKKTLLGVKDLERTPVSQDTLMFGTDLVKNSRIGRDLEMKIEQAASRKTAFAAGLKDMHVGNIAQRMAYSALGNSLGSSDLFSKVNKTDSFRKQGLVASEGDDGMFSRVPKKSTYNGYIPQFLHDIDGYGTDLKISHSLTSGYIIVIYIINNEYRYCVVHRDNPELKLIDFPACFHPYNIYPEPLRMCLSMFGMSASKDSLLNKTPSTYAP